MYEDYSQQSLPSKKYRELLGTALCVFNSNNSFVIENILRSDEYNRYNWYELIDRNSGNLNIPISETITERSNEEIGTLFSELCKIRNRIIHSFQITNVEGNQELATKDRDNIQFPITERYIMDFIKSNERLSLLLHNFRGY